MKLQGLLVNWKTRAIAAGTLASFAASGEAFASAMRSNDDANNKNVERVNDSAVDGQGKASQIVHDYKVPAGTLRDVTDAIANATGVKFHFLAGSIADVQSPGVNGVLSLEEALEAALKDTGIGATIDSSDSVTLKLKSANQDVTVVADGPQSIKYTAPLRDLPQTVTVIPQEVLQTTASTSLVEALRTVPGITFGAGEGGNPIGDRPYIRGVDSQASTFVDGMRDIGSQSREVFDLESIDVSKGPSGTYAGRGTSGGSLNLNSKMARRDSFLRGSFSPGNQNFYRGTLDGNTKLTSFMSGRLNGLWNSNGVAERDIVKSSRWGVAPATNFTIGKRGHLDLNYYHLMSNDLPDPGMPYNNPTFRARTDNLPRLFQVGDGQPLVVNRRNYYGLTNRDFRYEKVKTWEGRAQVDLWEGSVLRNTYRYGKSNQDYVYTMSDDSQGNIYYGLVWRRALQRNTVVNTSINQTDLSGHFKTGSMDHNYATGFEFSRESGWNRTYTVNVYNPISTRTASLCPYGAGAAGGYNCTSLFNPTPFDPWRSAGNSITKNTVPTASRTGTSSLYAFDTIRFVSKLQATVGVRYDHYNSSFLTAGTKYAAINNLVNYQAALNYKPKQAISIYGSVSTSAIPAGNSLNQGSDTTALNSTINANLQPEKTRSVEVGTKYELFGGRALATLAWFQSNTDNVRITLVDGTVAAAGKRRNRGIDLGITGDIGKKLKVFGGYTYMNAILVSAGGAGAASGLTDGTHFPNTPPHSFSITSSYFATRRFNVGGGLYGMTKVWGNESTNKWVPGYVRADLYGSYRFNKHLEVQGNLLNVGNKLYFIQAYTTHFATLAPGRTARATLNVLF